MLLAELAIHNSKLTASPEGPCLLAGEPHFFPIMGLFCRYVVANSFRTQECLHYAQQVMSSHDSANKSAEMDVTPAMGDMLTEMQGCLR